MELQLLQSSRGVVSAATIESVLDIVEDIAAQPAGEEDVDASILDEARQQLVAITFAELTARAELMGPAYPFHVDDARLQLRLDPAATVSGAGSLVYVFCLLASSVRNKVLTVSASLTQDIPNIFQVCACLAAGGYVDGSVSSFGFPRAKGDDFLPALAETFERFGAGKLHLSVPAGFPDSLKDGGIDVVAWKDHPDRMPGKTFLLGQVASGSNWDGKSVRPYIPQLRLWFATPPATDSLAAMFIPFTLHQDLPENDHAAFLDTVHGHFAFQEAMFGIVFDRARVAHYADLCMKADSSRRAEVEGADRLDDVKQWLVSACSELGIRLAIV
jgi:hypothetical protein